MKLKHNRNLMGEYHSYRRRITVYKYFNILGQRFRKKQDAKGVTRFYMWDGKTWQLMNWYKGNRIEKIAAEGHGKRSKRQPK